MDRMKYSFYFAQGGLELESTNPEQIDYINDQFKKKVHVLHIPSDNKNWYVLMDKIKAYAIEKLQPKVEKENVIQELKQHGQSTLEANNE